MQHRQYQFSKYALLFAIVFTGIFFWLGSYHITCSDFLLNPEEVLGIEKMELQLRGMSGLPMYQIVKNLLKEDCDNINYIIALSVISVFIIYTTVRGKLFSSSLQSKIIISVLTLGVCFAHYYYYSGVLIRKPQLDSFYFFRRSPSYFFYRNIFLFCGQTVCLLLMSFSVSRIMKEKVLFSRIITIVKRKRNENINEYYCGECFALVSKDAFMCGQCGVSFVIPEEEKERLKANCFQCGEEISIVTTKCPHCHSENVNKSFECGECNFPVGENDKQCSECKIMLTSA
jgi:ribosomal protein L40E